MTITTPGDDALRISFDSPEERTQFLTEYMKRDNDAAAALMAILETRMARKSQFRGIFVENPHNIVI